MNPLVPDLISCLALTVSVTTLWLSFLRKGTVRMTRPTIVFFRPDGVNMTGKIYLRTLLWSTSKQGQIVESMFIRLQRGESAQTFNIWAYGNERLVPGSGVYVGPEGLACIHNFLPPADTGPIKFIAGDYVLRVFAVLVGKEPLELALIRLHITDLQAEALCLGDSGVCFNWGPDSQRYVPHIRAVPSQETRLLRDLNNQA